MDDAVETDEIGYFMPTRPFSLIGAPSVHTLASLDHLRALPKVHSEYPLLFGHEVVVGTTQTHSWATSVTSVLSSTAMLQHGALHRSANNWSRRSFPMSSVRLIIVKSDNCNPLICLRTISLLSKSNNISAEKAIFYHFSIWECFFLPALKSMRSQKLPLFNALQ